MLLWEEYRTVHPDGYNCSRFCDLIREFEARLSPVKRQEHLGGQQGLRRVLRQKIGIPDPVTAMVRFAEIFVAVLGASSDETRAEAVAAGAGACEAFTYKSIASVIANRLDIRHNRRLACAAAGAHPGHDRQGRRRLLAAGQDVENDVRGVYAFAQRFQTGRFHRGRPSLSTAGPEWRPCRSPSAQPASLLRLRSGPAGSTQF